jgi:hypothetical protein
MVPSIVASRIVCRSRQRAAAVCVLGILVATFVAGRSEITQRVQHAHVEEVDDLAFA